MIKDNGAIFYGFNPPFIGGSQNYMSRQEDDRLIKNDILQLLFTIPGERVMRPDFGVNLRNYVFENAYDESFESLRTEIVSKIGIYEPRVIINSVEMNPDPDRNGLSIKIVVTLKKDPLKQLVIDQFIKATGVL